MQVERVDYIRVPVKDMEEASHFYGELLGLKRNPNSPGGDARAARAGRGCREGRARRGRAAGQRHVGLGRLLRRRRARPVRQPDPAAPSLRGLPGRDATVMQIERIDFIALPVEDLARADAYYDEKLGLARNPNTSGGRWVEYETGNLTLALSTFGGSLALGVADVGDAREELEEQDVQFAMDTFDSGVCHGAPLSDPDGNRLQLHNRYAALEPFATPEQEVLRTDFVGVNVRDRARAGEFYGGKLGLKRNTNSSDEWPEFEASNVGLVLSTPA